MPTYWASMALHGWLMAPHKWISLLVHALDIWCNKYTYFWARFLPLARSKLRLCSANHRPGYWSNPPCDWPSTACDYSEKETENGPWWTVYDDYLGCHFTLCWLWGAFLSPWEYMFVCIYAVCVHKGAGASNIRVCSFNMWFLETG